MKIFSRFGILSLCLGLCFGLLSSPFVARAAEDPAGLRGDAREVLFQARARTLSIREEGRYWMLPSYLGMHFTSQYFLALKWAGRAITDFDEARFRGMLLSTQLPDGSWVAVRDANLPSGDLNATILNYWVLKGMGLDVSQGRLAQAREWILARGGLAKAPMLTRVMFALFGVESWDGIPNMPYELFYRNWIITERAMAQWIGPHLIQVAYMRHLKLSRDLGPRFNIDELRVPGDPRLPREGRRFVRQERTFRSDRDHVRRILSRQLVGGSWGGYPVATLLGAMVLDDYALRDPSTSGEIATALDKAYHYLDGNFVHSCTGAYLGVQDSRYWDTALIGGALLEAGEDWLKLGASARYLVDSQTASGGFPFGNGFEATPDTDDTAEIAIFLQRISGYWSETNRGMQWLVQMQNDDGGWGAFSKNNNGNPLIEAAAAPFRDSADFFDDSSPDVTGHVLEAMGMFGWQQSGSSTVSRGADYLRRSQKRNGAWQGRWGITYLYGTGAAIAGLIRSGESPQSRPVRRAVEWLVSRQNPDGGWGETTLADTHPELAGVGVSTPTQTAWALIALMEAGEGRSEAAVRGARHLVESFRRTRGWVDDSATGTGHPGVFYEQYPAYAYAFPMIALSRFVALDP